MGKFSGISLPGNTYVFGKENTLRVYHDDNGSLSYSIRPRRFQGPFNPALLLFPLIDIVMFALYLLDPILPKLGTTVIIPDWAVILIRIGFYGVFFYLVVYFARAVEALAPWHGLEHKLIVSAEDGGLERAAEYSRISDRCGGSFLLSMLTVMSAFIATQAAFGLYPPVGIYSTILLCIYFEQKTFHDRNTWGLRFGRWLQERITTAEPDTDMLNVGIKGMEDLLKMETTKPVSV